ncbi:MAG: hypothetical protein VYA59_07805 [Pseudomonadota bacterium]|nr:hypothetical protein [Pseudomonadota bacterium]
MRDKTVSKDCNVSDWQRVWHGVGVTLGLFDFSRMDPPHKAAEPWAMRN